MFELQIADVPHGQEDFIYGDSLLFEIQHRSYIMQGLLASMIRSYKGGALLWEYSTISGFK